MSVYDHVVIELQAAKAAEALGDMATAFRHLERAHILGQNSTRFHVLAHIRMLVWAWKQRDIGEFFGQLFRIVGAATKTFMGLVPQGNSGGTNVSPFRSMPLPDDLQAIMKQSRR
jgi:hypothetical protein